MRRLFYGAAALAALGAIGCSGATTTYVKSETTLGRVVVYRNGVAYFERYADVQGDSLKLNVPQDKVDDFLKSLTVVDAKTGEPATVSYGSGGASGTIDMRIGASRPGAGPRRLRLSYVTEAPSWKPSYRVVIDKPGIVELQGWAIVDNTSGEDWLGVKLGVGASSAMSFRFDLKGLRMVERETLHDTDLFAQAPPMGGATYGGNGPVQRRIVGDLTDDAIAHAAAQQRDEEGDVDGAPGSKKTDPRSPRPGSEIERMAAALRSSQNTIVIEGFATSADKDKNAAALDRANRVRQELIQNGVDEKQVSVVARGEQPGRAGGARIVQNQDAPAMPADPAKVAAPNKPAVPPSTEPIGTSHFESASAMNVPRGSSAMVSILRSNTEGEVVYLFDPESARGNAQYPFRAVRFKNPTDSALESGPVSVFGEGKFVGEGLSEPIPPHAVAFVPFALDRQVVVERKDADRDDIARILTVQRGVFQTQISHTKRLTFTLYNRSSEKAAVYMRHTVAPGYRLTRSPEVSPDTPIKTTDSERMQGAHLFRVELEPNDRTDVVIEEATPVTRSMDIRTTAGLDLVRAYLSNAAFDGPLKNDIEKLLTLNTELVKTEQEIATTHEQMAEYRQRMDELHAQLVTLKAVKTAGPLMSHLEKKLQEVSEKLSKATVDVVSLQEKQMVARIRFQTGVGDLSLEGKDNRAAAK